MINKVSGSSSPAKKYPYDNTAKPPKMGILVSSRPDKATNNPPPPPPPLGSGGSDGGPPPIPPGGSGGIGRFHLSTIGNLMASIFLGGAIIAATAIFLNESTRQPEKPDVTQKSSLPSNPVKQNAAEDDFREGIDQLEERAAKVQHVQAPPGARDIPKEIVRNGDPRPAPPPHKPPVPTEPPVLTEPEVSPILFRTIRAFDNTYTVKIPIDWQLKEATIFHFSTESPSREKIFFYSLNVAGNAYTHALNMGGLDIMRRQGFPISEKQYALKSRLMSDFLPPERIVTSFIPSLMPDEIRNVKVLAPLQNKDLPENARHLGADSGNVHYSYLNTGGKPALLLEGLSTATATRPIEATGYKTWSFAITGSEAPPKLFKRNLPLYRKIHASLEFNLVAVQEEMAKQQALVESITRTIRESQEETLKTLEAGRKAQQEAARALGKALSSPQRP